MNHIWKIYDLNRTLSDGMVSKAIYACESDESGHSSRKIGEVAFTTGSASDSEFVAYEDLTENIVLGWVTGSIDTTAIEVENSSSIASSITAEANRTKENGTPWL
jgi:hypothetical protein